MTVDELYKFVLFIAKKNQNGANPSPDEFNLALSRAYIEWVMNKYGNDKKLIQGKDAPMVAYQKNQKISDDLMFLMETRSFDIVNGILPIPNGTTRDVTGAIAPSYLHLSSLRYTYYVNCKGTYTENVSDIEILRDDEVASVMSSRIVKPKKDFPIGYFGKDSITIKPREINRVTMTYLRKPTVPVWGYVVANNRPMYNSATSVQLESPDETHNDIAMRVLRYLGISIREPQLFQYANAMEKEGI